MALQFVVRFEFVTLKVKCFYGFGEKMAGCTFHGCSSHQLKGLASFSLPCVWTFR